MNKPSYIRQRVIPMYGDHWEIMGIDVNQYLYADTARPLLSWEAFEKATIPIWPLPPSRWDKVRNALVGALVGLVYALLGGTFSRLLWRVLGH